MTARYYFHPQSMPRTITREEWYRVWHDVRVGFRENKEALIKHNDFFQANYHRMPEHIKKQMLDEIIYPPIILGPYMDMFNDNMVIK